MNPFAYARAASLEDAVEKARGGGLLKAGGVDLLGRMKRGTLRPERLVDLNGLVELRGIRRDGESLRIGALVKLAEILESELVPEGLGEAARNAATPQIRNQASLAGNLLQSRRCWYLHDPEVSCEGKGGEGCPALEGRSEHHAILGDRACPVVNGSNTAPVLCALGAVLQVGSARGKESGIPLGELYGTSKASGKEPAFLAARLPEGSVATGVRIPLSGLASAHAEIRLKESYDWAIAMAAAAIKLEAGRIARAHLYLGAVAPVPWHARAAEGVVLGRKPSPELFHKAAASELEQARPLREGSYKLAMTRHVIVQALEMASRRAAR
ncbi:MAG: FAD binding domain-containing protein [Planctomycetota bacterium]